LMAQRRRGLLLRHHTPPNPTRSLPFRRRSAKRGQTLHRRPQQRLSTVRMDHFGQSDLRKTRPDPCTFCLSQCTRSRILSDNELRRVWTAAEACTGVLGPLIKFLLLTACRRQEAGAMAWDELQGEFMDSSA